MAVRSAARRRTRLGWSGWVSCIGAALALAFLLSAWFVVRGRLVAGQTDTSINITRGCVELQRRESSPEDVSQWLFVCRSTVPAGWDWWGWRKSEFMPGYSIYRFPWWPLVILTLPARFAVAWWRWRVRGRCWACGYSLAGLAAGVACPECGVVSSRRGAGGE